MNLWYWTFIVPFQCIAYKAVNLEMPVFAPNQYFWDKYWDGKDPEKKWQVYAEAVREAMAEVGGYELSDSTMDDKQAYVDLVWGAKVKRD